MNGQRWPTKVQDGGNKYMGDVVSDLTFSASIWQALAGRKKGERDGYRVGNQHCLPQRRASRWCPFHSRQPTSESSHSCGARFRVNSDSGCAASIPPE